MQEWREKKRKAMEKERKEIEVFPTLLCLHREDCLCFQPWDYSCVPSFLALYGSWIGDVAAIKREGRGV